MPETEARKTLAGSSILIAAMAALLLLAVVSSAAPSDPASAPASGTPPAAAPDETDFPLLAEVQLRIRVFLEGFLDGSSPPAPTSTDPPAPKVGLSRFSVAKSTADEPVETEGETTELLVTTDRPLTANEKIMLKVTGAGGGAPVGRYRLWPRTINGPTTGTRTMATFSRPDDRWHEPMQKAMVQAHVITRASSPTFTASSQMVEIKTEDDDPLTIETSTSPVSIAPGESATLTLTLNTLLRTEIEVRGTGLETVTTVKSADEQTFKVALSVREDAPEGTMRVTIRAAVPETESEIEERIAMRIAAFPALRRTSIGLRIYELPQAEKSDKYRLTITLNRALLSRERIIYEVTPSPGGLPEDYTLSPLLIQGPTSGPQATLATVFTAVDDDQHEEKETFTVRMTVNEVHYQGSPPRAVVIDKELLRLPLTITNDDALTIEASPPNEIPEGESRTVAVTLNTVLAATVSVSGAGIESATVAKPAGVRTVDVVLRTIAGRYGTHDAAIRADVPATGARADREFTIEIPAPPLTVTPVLLQTGAVIAEGDQHRLPLSLSRPLLSSERITFEAAGDAGATPQDYDLSPQLIEGPTDDAASSGETSELLAVSVFTAADDGQHEADEVFTVRARAVTSRASTPQVVFDEEVARITVTDNDALTIEAPGSVTVSEGESRNIAVTLNTVLAATVSVSGAGIESASVAKPAGVRTVDVALSASADAQPGTVRATVSAFVPTTGARAEEEFTVEIPPPPALTLTPLSLSTETFISEGGRSGFPLLLSRALGSSEWITFEAVGGAGATSSDYALSPQRIEGPTIAPRAATNDEPPDPLRVTPVFSALDDGQHEAAETFTVRAQARAVTQRASTPTSVGPDTTVLFDEEVARFTITDNDALTIEASLPDEITEGESRSITVTLNTLLEAAVRISGTGIEPDSATKIAGGHTVNIELRTIAGRRSTQAVTISAEVPGTGAQAEVIGHVQINPAPPAPLTMQLSAGDTVIAEGESQTLTLATNRPLLAGETVALEVAGAAATSESYSVSPQVVEGPTIGTQTIFAFSVPQDGLHEATTQTFTIQPTYRAGAGTTVQRGNTVVIVLEDDDALTIEASLPDEITEGESRTVAVTLNTLLEAVVRISGGAGIEPGTATKPAGGRTVNIELRTVAGRRDTQIVTVSAEVPATGAQAEVMGYVEINPAPPAPLTMQLSAGDTSIAEGESQTLTLATNRPLLAGETVALEVAGRAAATSENYSVSPQAVEGPTTGTQTVFVFSVPQDGLHEATTQTFTIQPTYRAGGSTTAQRSNTVVIGLEDDDALTIEASLPDEITEGESRTVAVTLNTLLEAAVRISGNAGIESGSTTKPAGTRTVNVELRTIAGRRDTQAVTISAEVPATGAQAEVMRYVEINPAASVPLTMQLSAGDTVIAEGESQTLTLATNRPLLTGETVALEVAGRAAATSESYSVSPQAVEGPSTSTQTVFVFSVPQDGLHEATTQAFAIQPAYRASAGTAVQRGNTVVIVLEDDDALTIEASLPNEITEGESRTVAVTLNTLLEAAVRISGDTGIEPAAVTKPAGARTVDVELRTIAGRRDTQAVTISAEVPATGAQAEFMQYVEINLAAPAELTMQLSAGDTVIAEGESQTLTLATNRPLLAGETIALEVAGEDDAVPGDYSVSPQTMEGPTTGTQSVFVFSVPQDGLHEATTQAFVIQSAYRAGESAVAQRGNVVVIELEDDDALTIEASLPNEITEGESRTVAVALNTLLEATVRISGDAGIEPDSATKSAGMRTVDISLRTVAGQLDTQVVIISAEVPETGAQAEVMSYVEINPVTPVPSAPPALPALQLSAAPTMISEGGSVALTLTVNRALTAVESAGVQPTERDRLLEAERLVEGPANPRQVTTTFSAPDDSLHEATQTLLFHPILVHEVLLGAPPPGDEMNSNEIVEEMTMVGNVPLLWRWWQVNLYEGVEITITDDDSLIMEAPSSVTIVDSESATVTLTFNTDLEVEVTASSWAIRNVAVTKPAGVRTLEVLLEMPYYAWPGRPRIRFEARAAATGATATAEVILEIQRRSELELSLSGTGTVEEGGSHELQVMLSRPLKRYERLSFWVTNESGNRWRWRLPGNYRLTPEVIKGPMTSATTLTTATTGTGTATTGTGTATTETGTATTGTGTATTGTGTATTMATATTQFSVVFSTPDNGWHEPDRVYVIRGGFNNGGWSEYYNYWHWISNRAVVTVEDNDPLVVGVTPSAIIAGEPTTAEVSFNTMWAADVTGPDGTVTSLDGEVIWGGSHSFREAMVLARERIAEARVKLESGESYSKNLRTQGALGVAMGQVWRALEMAWLEAGLIEQESVGNRRQARDIVPVSIRRMWGALMTFDDFSTTTADERFRARRIMDPDIPRRHTSWQVHHAKLLGLEATLAGLDALIAESLDATKRTVEIELLVPAGADRAAVSVQVPATGAQATAEISVLAPPPPPPPPTMQWLGGDTVIGEGGSQALTLVTGRLLQTSETVALEVTGEDGAPPGNYDLSPQGIERSAIGAQAAFVFSAPQDNLHEVTTQVFLIQPTYGIDSRATPTRGIATQITVIDDGDPLTVHLPGCARTLGYHLTKSGCRAKCVTQGVEYRYPLILNTSLEVHLSMPRTQKIEEFSAVKLAGTNMVELVVKLRDDWVMPRGLYRLPPAQINFHVPATGASAMKTFYVMTDGGRGPLEAGGTPPVRAADTLTPITAQLLGDAVIKVGDSHALSLALSRTLAAGESVRFEVTDEDGATPNTHRLSLLSLRGPLDGTQFKMIFLALSGDDDNLHGVGQKFLIKANVVRNLSSPSVVFSSEPVAITVDDDPLTVEAFIPPGSLEQGQPATLALTFNTLLRAEVAVRGAGLETVIAIKPADTYTFNVALLVHEDAEPGTTSMTVSASVPETGVEVEKEFEIEILTFSTLTLTPLLPQTHLFVAEGDRRELVFTLNRPLSNSERVTFEVVNERGASPDYDLSPRLIEGATTRIPTVTAGETPEPQVISGFFSALDDRQHEPAETFKVWVRVSEVRHPVSSSRALVIHKVLVEMTLTVTDNDPLTMETPSLVEIEPGTEAMLAVTLNTLLEAEVSVTGPDVHSAAVTKPAGTRTVDIVLRAHDNAVSTGSMTVRASVAETGAQASAILDLHVPRLALELSGDGTVLQENEAIELVLKTNRPLRADESLRLYSSEHEYEVTLESGEVLTYSDTPRQILEGTTTDTEVRFTFAPWPGDDNLYEPAIHDLRLQISAYKRRSGGDQLRVSESNWIGLTVIDDDPLTIETSSSVEIHSGTEETVAITLNTLLEAEIGVTGPDIQPVTVTKPAGARTVDVDLRGHDGASSSISVTVQASVAETGAQASATFNLRTLRLVLELLNDDTVLQENETVELVLKTGRPLRADESVGLYSSEFQYKVILESGEVLRASETRRQMVQGPTTSTEIRFTFVPSPGDDDSYEPAIRNIRVQMSAYKQGYWRDRWVLGSNLIRLTIEDSDPLTVEVTDTVVRTITGERTDVHVALNTGLKVELEMEVPGRDSLITGIKHGYLYRREGTVTMRISELPPLPPGIHSVEIRATVPQTQATARTTFNLHVAERPPITVRLSEDVVITEGDEHPLSLELSRPLLRSESVALEITDENGEVLENYWWGERWNYRKLALADEGQTQAYIQGVARYGRLSQKWQWASSELPQFSSLLFAGPTVDRQDEIKFSAKQDHDYELTRVFLIRPVYRVNQVETQRGDATRITVEDNDRLTVASARISNSHLSFLIWPNTYMETEVSVSGEGITAASAVKLAGKTYVGLPLRYADDASPGMTQATIRARVPETGAEATVEISVQIPESSPPMQWLREDTVVEEGKSQTLTLMIGRPLRAGETITFKTTDEAGREYPPVRGVYWGGIVSPRMIEGPATSTQMTIVFSARQDNEHDVTTRVILVHPVYKLGQAVQRGAAARVTIVDDGDPVVIRPHFKAKGSVFRGCQTAGGKYYVLSSGSWWGCNAVYLTQGKEYRFSVPLNARWLEAHLTMPQTKAIEGFSAIKPAGATHLKYLVVKLRDDWVMPRGRRELKAQVRFYVPATGAWATKTFYVHTNGGSGEGILARGEVAPGRPISTLTPITAQLSGDAVIRGRESHAVSLALSRPLATGESVRFEVTGEGGTPPDAHRLSLLYLRGPLDDTRFETVFWAPGDSDDDNLHESSQKFLIKANVVRNLSPPSVVFSSGSVAITVEDDPLVIETVGMPAQAGIEEPTTASVSLNTHLRAEVMIRGEGLETATAVKPAGVRTVDVALSVSADAEPGTVRVTVSAFVPATGGRAEETLAIEIPGPAALTLTPVSLTTETFIAEGGRSELPLTLSRALRSSEWITFEVVGGAGASSSDYDLSPQRMEGPATDDPATADETPDPLRVTPVFSALDDGRHEAPETFTVRAQAVTQRASPSAEVLFDEEVAQFTVTDNDALTIETPSSVEIDFGAEETITVTLNTLLEAEVSVSGSDIQPVAVTKPAGTRTVEVALQVHDSVGSTASVTVQASVAETGAQASAAFGLRVLRLALELSGDGTVLQEGEAVELVLKTGRLLRADESLGLYSSENSYEVILESSEMLSASETYRQMIQGPTTDTEVRFTFAPWPGDDDLYDPEIRHLRLQVFAYERDVQHRVSESNPVRFTVEDSDPLTIEVPGTAQVTIGETVEIPVTLNTELKARIAVKMPGDLPVTHIKPKDGRTFNVRLPDVSRKQPGIYTVEVRAKLPGTKATARTTFNLRIMGRSSVTVRLSEDAVITEGGEHPLLLELSRPLSTNESVTLEITDGNGEVLGDYQWSEGRHYRDGRYRRLMLVDGRGSIQAHIKGATGDGRLSQKWRWDSSQRPLFSSLLFAGPSAGRQERIKFSALQNHRYEPTRAFLLRPVYKANGAETQRGDATRITVEDNDPLTVSAEILNSHFDFSIGLNTLLDAEVSVSGEGIIAASTFKSGRAYRAELPLRYTDDASPGTTRATIRARVLETGVEATAEVSVEIPGSPPAMQWSGGGMMIEEGGSQALTLMTSRLLRASERITFKVTNESDKDFSWLATLTPQTIEGPTTSAETTIVFSAKQNREHDPTTRIFLVHPVYRLAQAAQRGTAVQVTVIEDGDPLTASFLYGCRSGSKFYISGYATRERWPTRCDPRYLEKGKKYRYFIELNTWQLGAHLSMPQTEAIEGFSTLKGAGGRYSRNVRLVVKLRDDWVMPRGRHELKARVSAYVPATGALVTKTFYVHTNGGEGPLARGTNQDRPPISTLSPITAQLSGDAVISEGESHALSLALSRPLARGESVRLEVTGEGGTPPGAHRLSLSSLYGPRNDTRFKPVFLASRRSDLYEPPQRFLIKANVVWNLSPPSVAFSSTAIVITVEDDEPLRLSAAISEVTMKPGQTIALPMTLNTLSAAEVTVTGAAPLSVASVSRPAGTQNFEVSLTAPGAREWTAPVQIVVEARVPETDARASFSLQVSPPERRVRWQGTRSPLVHIGTPSTVSAATFNAVFNFSEAVTGFTREDITVENGEVRSLRKIKDHHYRATIRPRTAGAGSITVRANAAKGSEYYPRGRNELRNAAVTHAFFVDHAFPGERIARLDYNRRNPRAPSPLSDWLSGDMTDSDGDGMSDAAERKYGYDPNDASSFPQEDGLSDNIGSVSASSGVGHQNNRIWYRLRDFSTSETRQWRDFLKKAWPLLYYHLGPPAETFMLEIVEAGYGYVTLNEGRTVRWEDGGGFDPRLMLHELTHVWKGKYAFTAGRRWEYNSDLSGFEEGITDGMAYGLMHEYMRSYPTDAAVRRHMFDSSGGAHTYQYARDRAVTMDMDKHKDFTGSGYFWHHSRGIAGMNYAIAAVVVQQMLVENPNAYREIMAAYYRKIKSDSNWRPNRRDLIEIWESAVPEVNRIPLPEYLDRVPVFNGRDLRKGLYVVNKPLFYELSGTNSRSAWMTFYVPRDGASGWAIYRRYYDPATSHPPWISYSLGEDGYYYQDNQRQPFTVAIRDLQGRLVQVDEYRTEWDRDDDGSPAGLGWVVDEDHYSFLPFGLYKEDTTFTNYILHTARARRRDYVFGNRFMGLWLAYAESAYAVAVGMDGVDEGTITIHVNGMRYTSKIIRNAVLFTPDIVNDFRGKMEIEVADRNGNTCSYERTLLPAVTAWGYSQRWFVIRDANFDCSEEWGPVP